MRKISLSSAAIAEAAECLKIVAHPARLQIIQLLMEGGRSVNELAELCSVRQNVASTHLKLMERCGFLKGVREGKNVIYTVTEKHLFDLLKCIEKRFS